MNDVVEIVKHEHVDWRQTGRYLWVGSRHGYHVGVIEHGFGWVAIDDGGEVLGRFRSLEAAQDALAMVIPEQPIAS